MLKPIKLKQKKLPPVTILPSVCDLYMAGEVMYGTKPSHPPIENPDIQRRNVGWKSVPRSQRQ